MNKHVFFCTNCDRWTPVAPKSWGGVRCYICGDDYQCGDCGYEISRDGDCQRPLMTGEWCYADGVVV